MSKACDSQESSASQRRVDAALGGVAVRADRVDLGDDPDRRPVLRGGEGRALAGEAGSDYEDVVVRHEAVAILFTPAAAPRSARRTASTVTIPRSTPSPSTAITAPRRPRLSCDSSASSGSSSPARRPSAAVVAGHHRRDRAAAAGRLGHAADGLARHHPDQVTALVDDREPGPAVAQEELALGPFERQLLGDRDRLGVHHVRHAQVVDAVRERPPRPRPNGRPGRGRSR